jgi:hypothetical protein
VAKYGSDDTRIDVDNSGGTLQNMTAYITEVNGFGVEAVLEESTPFGVAWEESLYSGVKMVADIELTGFYDDTASTGPDVIFNALGETRTVKITWGSTKTSSVEAIIRKYERIAKVKETTKYKVTLKPTGAVTEA